ncbi:Putative uncharacterized protein yxeP [Thermobacillus xylanilyticus]|uniref:Peptidase M20 dimerisation domain-containing protein n=1 Tax=Thermobacillus xylanilyticus TaxID=76633 RepID=A0ABM8V4Y0_THEXY|nr:amidohydrolase [Thermobacillus xylanilyticus]CAG5087628.1 Putative uncharacterized protein yxeP [Thermobacillus xylanilyticus]
MPLQALKDSAGALAPHLVAIRRELHMHPELSLEEFETTRRIRGWLEEAGLSVQTFGLKTGLVVDIEGASPGPTVALRADIDALPVTEETGLPFASCEPGKMHACGHDFHTASMIGAALLLHKRRDQLKGRVRMLFQPAEEIAAGARAMIRAGVLEGVDAILGMHNKPELPVGTVGIRTGALMASVDRFEIRVTGKGGHGAIPDAAVDPIVAASAIVGALQTIVSRNVSPLESAVISVCRFQSGATWNVIPDCAELEGTVRTFNADVRRRIPEQIRRVAEGVAAGYGASAELIWTEGQHFVNNDPAMAALMTRAAEELGLTVVEARPTTAGEDFSVYQEHVPGCFIWMGTSGTEEWHHPKFTLNEDALPVSAALFAHAAELALETLA